MDILPGVGLPLARLGQRLPDIEAAAGPATLVEPRRARWDHHEPPFAVYFDRVGVAELVEAYEPAGTAERLTLGGVQLTSRLMDEVEADLSRIGLIGRRAGFVVDFDDGFTLWSLGELLVGETAGDAGHAAGAEQLVVEGVSIGRFAGSG